MSRLSLLHTPGVLLILVLLPFLVASPATAVAASITPLVRVSGPSPFATCVRGGLSPDSGTNYTNAEVEPYVAVNPANRANIIGVWQQDRWADGGAHGLVAGYSLDGGRTWGESPLPFGVCARDASTDTRASDPWISIGPDGRAYAISISFGEESAVQAATSIDGGRTWTNLRDIQRDTSAQGFNDKESITVDPVKPGVAYAVWDRVQGGVAKPAQPAWFSMTSDGGNSWRVPKQITHEMTPLTGTIGNQIVVDGKRHVLYDVFSHIVERKEFHTVCKGSKGQKKTCTKVRTVLPNPQFEENISFIRSTNAGKTWSKPSAISTVSAVDVPVQQGGPFRVGEGLGDAAIDPRNGTLYVTWADARSNPGQFNSIVLSNSSDGGKHWTSPHAVTVGSRAPQFVPSVEVNAKGVVGVTYYDLRIDTQNSPGIPVDYWFQSSTDGGKHFGKSTHIAGPFDMHSAPLAGGYFLGDYAGLAASGTSFQPFFVATNSGNETNRTDVFTTTIAP